MFKTFWSDQAVWGLSDLPNIALPWTTKAKFLVPVAEDFEQPLATNQQYHIICDELFVISLPCSHLSVCFFSISMSLSRTLNTCFLRFLSAGWIVTWRYGSPWWWRWFSPCFHILRVSSGSEGSSVGTWRSVCPTGTVVPCPFRS